MHQNRPAILALCLLASCAPETTVEQHTPVGYRDLLAEANDAIETSAVAAAMSLLADTNVAFIDLREQHELDSIGTIPGAIHAPRGMLEFYIDSTSRSHKDVFSSGKRIVFYCAAGGRSALATQTAMNMGLDNVTHIEGGIRAWIEAGGPVQPSGPPTP